MAIDAINTANGADAATAAGARTRLSDNYDTFLVLLTAQLQNQDPLAPMDSTQFTQQLVQFSQVEQQIRTNEQLEGLSASIKRRPRAPPSPISARTRSFEADTTIARRRRSATGPTIFGEHGR